MVPVVLPVSKLFPALKMEDFPCKMRSARVSFSVVSSDLPNVDVPAVVVGYIVTLSGESGGESPLTSETSNGGGGGSAGVVVANGAASA